MRAQSERLHQRLALRREVRAILLLALLAVLFTVLAVLANSAGLLAVDRAITRRLQLLRNPVLDGLALGLTFFGNTAVLGLMAAIAAGVLWGSNRRWAALLGLFTFLSIPLNAGLKLLIDRPRPTTELVEVVTPAIGLSFPSGHAMGAVAFYGFLALMAWIHVPRRKTRRVWATACVLLALGVSLSRVYLGVHWSSDVLAGSAAGLLYLLALAEIYYVVGTKELKPSE